MVNYSFFSSCLLLMCDFIHIYSQFMMREPQSCKVACRVKLSEAEAKGFKKKIKDDYRVNM